MQPSEAEGFGFGAQCGFERFALRHFAPAVDMACSCSSARGPRGIPQRRGCGRSAGWLPHRPFGTRSRSGAAPSGSAPLGAGISARDAGEVLHQLLQQSSSQAGVLSGMQRRLANLDSLEVRLRTLEQRPAPATQEPLPTPTGDSAPAWAPQLFAEGSRAELDTNQLQHLLQLAGRGPRRLGDLGSTSGGARPRPSSGRLGATPKAEPLP